MQVTTVCCLSVDGKLQKRYNVDYELFQIESIGNEAFLS